MDLIFFTCQISEKGNELYVALYQIVVDLTKAFNTIHYGQKV